MKTYPNGKIRSRKRPREAIKGPGPFQTIVSLEGSVDELD